MGMYTQFVIECNIKQETPQEVIKCLHDMVDGVDNDLFTYTRNPLNNYCQSNEYPKSFDNFILKAHGEIKNHWDDIGRFVEFITPHVECGLLDDDDCDGAFAKSLYDGFYVWTYYYIDK